jgi:hypothetical protein
MTPDNFLFLEPLIKTALREALDPRVHVLSAAELEGVAEATQPTPAVHVLYRGYRVGESRMASHVNIEQTWLTVVACRQVRDVVGGADARALAGPLAAAVIDALHYTRFPNAKPLRLAQAPAAGFSAGHFYLPIGWTAEINLRSDTCGSN